MGRVLGVGGGDGRGASRTVGHGPREDEGGSAAAHGVRRVVAGVDVDPVFREVAQATQHCALPGHFVLLDLEIRVVSPKPEGPGGPAVPPRVSGECASQSRGRAPETPPPSPARLTFEGSYGWTSPSRGIWGDPGGPGQAPPTPPPCETRSSPA